jgi:hypothetical protein
MPSFETAHDPPDDRSSASNARDVADLRLARRSSYVLLISLAASAAACVGSLEPFHGANRSSIEKRLSLRVTRVLTRLVEGPEARADLIKGSTTGVIDPRGEGFVSQ